MYSLGGRLAPPLENRYRVEMYAHSPFFNGQLKEKNFTDNFNSLSAGEGGKKDLKKGKKI